MSILSLAYSTIRLAILPSVSPFCRDLPTCGRRVADWLECSLIPPPQADPVTPFENAQLMADLLGDSAVLVRQNGFGHASLAEKSSCTIGVVSKYFQNGEASDSSSHHQRFRIFASRRVQKARMNPDLGMPKGLCTRPS